MARTDQRAHRGRATGAALVLTLVALLISGTSTALADAPGGVGTLETETALVAGGAGNQFVPKLSGELLAYADVSSAESSIRYFDLADRTAGTVPADAGNRDSLPDVSGDLIVFRRVFTDRPARPVMLYDVGAPELGVREVAPDPTARRFLPAVGGTTVAFTEFSSGSSNSGDLCVADVADLAAPATCLTSDGATMINEYASVSPDGATVAWHKCLGGTGLGCEIYVSRRAADGAWSAPLQLTDDEFENFDPDTDGTVVTYSAIEYPIVGEQESFVRWISVDGSSGQELDLAAVGLPFAAYPSISADVITFEGEAPGSDAADVYAYRLTTGQLYRLTETPSVDEIQSAVSVGPTGLMRVAWARSDGTLGSNDVHALHAQLPQDDEPPVLTVPDDVTVTSADGGPVGVEYEVTAHDEVDGPVTPACEPPSGSAFAVGTTTVTCTATDSGGNTASGSFEVTVVAAESAMERLRAAILATDMPRLLRAVLLVQHGLADRQFDQDRDRAGCAALGSMDVLLAVQGTRTLDPADEAALRALVAEARDENGC